MLYLIRYPTVQVNLDERAIYWPLSEVGRKQAHKLADLRWWQSVKYVYSSTEIKGVETAEIVCRNHTHIKPQALTSLDEVRSPTAPVSDEEYKRRVQQFFMQPDKSVAAGWQSASVVTTLVLQTMQDIAGRHYGENVAVISHGLALTLYRAQFLQRPATFRDWLLMTPGCWGAFDVPRQKVMTDWTPLESN